MCTLNATVKELLLNGSNIAYRLQAVNFRQELPNFAYSIEQVVVELNGPIFLENRIYYNRLLTGKLIVSI